MVNNFTLLQITRFKRQAKALAREQSITHAHALDRIANQQGFANWSILSKHGESTARGKDIAATAVVPAVRALSESERLRYYLHGDQSEEDSSHFFCARCDLFVDEGHFKDDMLHRGQTHADRYLRAIANWGLRDETTKRRIRRADNVVNLLADRAVARRDELVAAEAVYQASRSRFHRWLLNQAERDDPVGDLAGDVRRDELFPMKDERWGLEQYFARYGSHALSSFNQAWREFTLASRAG